MKCQVFTSKLSDDWSTPSHIYKQVIEKGYFDPCPLNSDEDGLNMEWGNKNFVNPPFSQLLKWIEKSIEEHKKGKQIILLIPARTDTKAFKKLFEYGAVISFIHGRLKYNDKGSAPFPSMLVFLVGHGLTRCNLIEREAITL